nr:hypothetical protein [Tanacetum cinerariifolium]
MQQFWYTIKKVQGTDSYEFLLANKKCTINANVFRTILDICPRVEGVDFTDVPDDDIALTCLIDLGYKGPLNKHTNMFMDYMHQPWRTLAPIINKCLSGNTASNDKLKKYRIGILGRGSEGKKIVDDSQETIDVYEESEPEPKLSRKKTSSKRRAMKKVTISVEDNIIFDDPDTALELGKSISQTKAEEAKAEVARKVHATHARIVTKLAPEPARRRKSGKVTFDPLKKLKDVPYPTLAEQEAADIVQALKESRKSSRRQPGTEGSDEGTGSIPGVLDDSIIISATSGEGTSIKPGDPDEENDITKEKVILELGDEQDNEFFDDVKDDVKKDDKDGDADDEGDDHVIDTQDADDEDVRTKSDKYEIYKYKIRVRKDEDVEMENSKAEESDKGDEKVNDAAKKYAKNTSEVKDDTKKTELPPSSSSLSVSLGFGDQFLKISSDFSLVSTVKDFTDVDVSSLMDIPIQQETPQTQSPSVQKVPVSMIIEITVRSLLYGSLTLI